MKKGLIALAFGTFGLGIAEFVVMGILGNVASGLKISITQAGYLISLYSLGVCVGSPLLLIMRRYPLKNLLLMLVGISMAGNLVASLSPSFLTIVAARFVSGLPHGAYFGVASIVAERLAGREHRTQAVSIMIAGMTVATLLGVPLGTALSTYISWRMVFLLVVAWSAVTIGSLWRWVPDVGRIDDTGFRGQFRFLKSLAPWLIIFGTMIGNGGLYCWYSYIDPLLTNISGYRMEDLTWLMVIAGAGMVTGNLVSGRLSDRFHPSIVAAMIQTAMILVLLLDFACASSRWAMLPLMFLGTAGLFGVSSPMQSLILQYSKGGELFGAATVQMAFNIGNALGTYCGGLVLAQGFDCRYPTLVGVPFSVVGALLLYYLYFRYERKS